MAEWLEPAEFRQIVRNSNGHALERPCPQLLIVEAVRRFPFATVIGVGHRRFLLPVEAVEFVTAGCRIILDQIPDAGRVVQPLDDHNQPLLSIPIRQ